MLFDEPGSTFIRATSPAAVANAMESVFAAETVTVDSHAITFTQRIMREERFAFAATDIQGRLRAEADALPFYVVTNVLRGSQSVSAGAQTWARADPEPFLFPLQRKTVRWTNARLEQTALRADAVDRVIREHGGGLAPRSLRLGHTPRDGVRARHWNDTVSYARRLSTSPLITEAPLSRSAVFTVLAAAFVDAFALPADSRTDDARSPDTGSATVRRARAYIDAHAADDLDVATIAAAVGVSVRSLQHAFLRHDGETPVHASDRNACAVHARTWSARRPETGRPCRASPPGGASPTRDGSPPTTTAPTASTRRRPSDATSGERCATSGERGAVSDQPGTASD